MNTVKYTVISRAPCTLPENIFMSTYFGTARRLNVGNRPRMCKAVPVVEVF